MDANEAINLVKAIINQVQDPIERQKLENWILGAVESKEKRKDRIRASLDKKERYQIKPTKKKL